jgi:hypothetical protein
MTRRPALVFASAVLAVIGTFSTSSPAKAECPYVPPYPPVTEAARSAREIIVGTVIENVGGQFADFRLRIDHVLRGPAQVGDIRRVTYLYAKWPLETLANGEAIAPCEAIVASRGNVIALAFDAMAPDLKTRYNAISWISGQPEFNYEFETTTLTKLQALADLPQTGTVAESAGAMENAPSPPFDQLFVVVVTGVGAGLVTVLRLKSRRPRLTAR